MGQKDVAIVDVHGQRRRLNSFPATSVTREWKGTREAYRARSGRLNVDASGHSGQAECELLLVTPRAPRARANDP